MHLSTTLSSYFGRQFLAAVFGTFMAIMAVVFLLDLIELLRRGASREDAGLLLLVQMAVLKAPHMGLTILPFAVLFGSMIAFTRMTRNQELVVARAAGVSVWQFLLPALAAAAVIGIVKVGLINPIASTMTARYESLENQILRNRDNFAALSKGGLWLRERRGDGYSVLYAAGISGEGESSGLGRVSVFLFGANSEFLGRVDASSAQLLPGRWELKNSVYTTPDAIPQIRDKFAIETTLTMENIQDSFASPETMSFWELPKFISILEEAGFPAVRHRLYFHAELASPLLLCAMVLIAATFSLRLTRRGGTLGWAVAGLFSGFLLYFISDLVFALGLSSRIPEVLAAWTPATVTTMLGVTSLLHLEDG